MKPFFQLQICCSTHTGCSWNRMLPRNDQCLLLLIRSLGCGCQELAVISWGVQGQVKCNGVFSMVAELKLGSSERELVIKRIRFSPNVFLFSI